jgi:hypothetical protein
MIKKEKLGNAMYAFQGMLFWARNLASKGQDKEKLVKLLDYLEYIPKLIVDKDDKTELFTDIVDELADNYEMGFVRDRFNEKLPNQW